MMVLTNNVTKYRQGSRLSMGALAIQARVGRTTIWNVEHGIIVPRVDTALLICQALGRTVEEVFTFAEID